MISFQASFFENMATLRNLVAALFFTVVLSSTHAEELKDDVTGNVTVRTYVFLDYPKLWSSNVSDWCIQQPATTIHTEIIQYSPTSSYSMFCIACSYNMSLFSRLSILKRLFLTCWFFLHWKRWQLAVSTMSSNNNAWMKTVQQQQQQQQ